MTDVNKPPKPPSRPGATRRPPGKGKAVNRAAGSRDARDATAVKKREGVVTAREDTATRREAAAGVREDAAGVREETSTLREETVRAREQAAQAKSELELLMGQVREANERLIVGSVRAQTMVEDAEQAGHLKDEFLATVSHELRTPLNAILGWARMLGSQQLPIERAKYAIAVIERNAAALAHIIEDLLDVSRIAAGTLRLAPRLVDLAAAAEAALDAVRPLAATSNVQLAFAPSPGIPAVVGDAGRLQQVIWNLLANAIKFTPEGGRVDVVVEPSNGHVEIRVVDTGQGISPDFLPHVFERFRQADAATTRRHTGLGLGLALVRQLVELHGGTVDAASPGVGHGATFTVRLPVSAGAHAGEAAAIGERRIAASAAPPMPRVLRLDGLRILVIDDSADGRALTSLLLTEAGASVTAVASAREALQRLAVERPDVMVSDIGLPDEDGYALIRYIRQHESQHGGVLPAVALTGYVRAEDRARVLTAGFHAHVAKPVDPVELVAAIAAVVRRDSRPIAAPRAPAHSPAEAPAQNRAEAERLMDQMREANERLLVAAVDAQNQSDEAHAEAARARAELDDLMNRLQEANERLATAAAHAQMMAEEAAARQEEYRRLSSRLLTLQDEERRRLALDLHDSTAQCLAALTMNLDLVAGTQRALGARSHRALAESRALAEQCAREVRTLAYLLHPPLLDERGLLPAVRWYVEGFTKRSGIQVFLDLGEVGRLPHPIETALFRVVQESLTNVHRHASSTTASIRLTSTAAAVALDIRDQGHGPRDGSRLADGTLQPATLGVGIQGMRERIRQLGGAFDIAFTDTGTTVHVRVPLHEDVA